MRYVSFDIECAKVYGDFSPICNFGYVIYDESLTLIEKKDIIINPRTNFKLKGRKGREDVELKYPVEVYKKAPGFKFYYKTIKNILEYKDQIIMNHAVLNDINYIKNELKRMSLPEIKYKAYDTVDIYKAISNSKGSVSLDKIVDNYLDPQPFTHHKADDDADAAMKFFIKSCEMMELNPKEMIEVAGIKPFDSTKDYSSPKKKRAIKINKIIHKTKKLNVLYEGKKIAISKSLEKNLNISEEIITAIYQLGGQYTNLVSDADLFIYEKDKHCKRCESFLQNIDKGNDISGVLYEEFRENANNVIIKSMINKFNN
jgi:DNA polymerase III alpha subunit (gram-positive type)